MRVTWEEKDLYPGRRFQKPDCGLSGSHMVGYDPSLDKEAKYGIVSMSDGMFTVVGTLKQVSDYLNACGHYVPVELCPRQWCKENS